MAQPVDSFDQILRTPSQEFDFANPQVDIDQLEAELRDVRNRYGALMLPAQQIGYPYRVGLFPLKENPTQCFLMFNPRIVYYSPEKTTYKEGSVNFIGLACKVTRAATVRARYQTRTGETITTLFENNLSNALQQMCDQMNGRPFFHQANVHDRQRVIRQWKQLAREQKKNPLVFA